MTVLEKVRMGLAHGGDAVRRMIGAPDYERYVEHMRASHPDRAPLTQHEFLRARLVSRYSTPGSRCC